MAKLVLMPKLGLTMTEGRIVKWYKDEGDKVNKGDILFEVETDKLTNNIEADIDGVLRKQLVQQGGMAKVTAPVAVIGEENEDISNLLSEDSKEKAPQEEEKESSIGSINLENKMEILSEGNSKGYVKASPLAKKIAKDNGVDLSLLKGRGFEGRVIEKDVLDFIEEEKHKFKASPMAVKVAKDFGVDLGSISKEGRIMKEDVLATVKPKVSIEAEEDKVEVPSSMRKTIAKRMSESWSTSPRVAYNIELDFSKMKELKNSLGEKFKAAGAKLSYNHILMKVIGRCLKEFPYINGSYNGEEIILHSSVNIGLAVDIENGLVVPNVKDIQYKSLFEIALETESLIDKARAGGLKPEDMAGGTFTITNIGMYGIDSFSPIINQPELGILGVSAVVDRPVVVEGEIVIRPIMKVTLTADHRVIDGAMAAKFLSRFKEIVENPYLLLM